ncbi:MAG: BMP family ABC transporter substrate-binding protein [Anaerolineae bacterium]|nr:BMP family ABC transporter substrate-binding protein [Anaerolineae bacterium]
MIRTIFRLMCLLCVVAAGVMPVFAAAGGGEQGQPTRQDELKIGLVTDVGDVDDGGFNQSAWEAVLMAQEELGATVDYRRTIDPSDREANIAAFAEDAYDIIVTVGFALQEQTLLAAEKYPDVQFIGVDMAFDTDLTNLTGLIFPEDRAGFLAGVLAAGLTQSNIVGGVFGTDIVPAVVKFKEGFESGLRWAEGQFDKDITFISTYHPEGPEVAFVDPTWGATTAFLAIDEGADVVFAAAGETGNAALIETAANMGDSPLYCIGVDTDQWNTVADAHPCLISSAQKLITQGVFDLILGYVAGTIPAGNFVGEVGLAPFHDFEEQIPADLKALLVEVERSLRNGAILTCYGLDLTGMKIGVVPDVGPIDDNSFNEGTYRGALAAGHCGATVDYVETQDTTDYANNIAEFADQGYNIIITVGWALAEATTAAAAAYPDIRFIGVDQIYDEPVPGVTGLVFREDQAGYLAGVLAGNLTESGTVASVLGTDQSPQIRAFAAGFEFGAQSVSEDIDVISTYHPGEFDASFLDPQWGATTAEQALNNGADVLFAAAGVTGNGALLEVASSVTDGNPPYCIGVDVDQWLTLPEAHPCLVSSSMKLLDAGVATLILQTMDNTIKDGNYFGQVGLAPFHDFDSVIPVEVKLELEQLANDLRTGKVETGFTYGE